jgi:hypothetical protein
MDQHLDAEHLAAFMDGRLSRGERAALEAHAADCPRCLHLLASMVRTEDPSPARRAFWRLPVLRWSVPLLAGATAVALWINVRPERSTSPMPPTLTTRDVAPPEIATPAAAPQAKEEVDQLRVQADERKLESRGIGAIRADQPSARESPGRSKAAQEVAESVPAVAPLADSDLRQLPLSAPPAVPQTVPSAPPPAASAAAPQAKPSSDTARQFRTEDRLNESVSVRESAATTLEVASPDASTRWRVAGRTIVRSNDAGKTWSAENVPVQREIAAGSSPSPLVAWFVGRGGYILMTAARNQWRRISFPETTDLASVTARSEREAEVTTSDGRVFVTTDGGRTWTRRPSG